MIYLLTMLLLFGCGYQPAAKEVPVPIPGLQGDKGDPGTKGDKGDKGDPGFPGLPGKDALPCSVAATPGGALLTCPGGTSSVVANGTNGIDGLDGIDGSNGLNGSDGQDVTTVDFCPAYTGVYPSTFPEYGMCISGSIYAVYWDNHNAWLAKVYPGYYRSTSTSAPCNFTVLANCIIQEN